MSELRSVMMMDMMMYMPRMCMMMRARNSSLSAS